MELLVTERIDATAERMKSRSENQTHVYFVLEAM